MCGRLTPTMLRPSPGSWFICAHMRPPPAPGLYWMMVSTAGQRFFSTSCWCRADRSDSPPAGNACQYRTFLSGQVCAKAGNAAARHRTASSFFIGPSSSSCGSGCGLANGCYRIDLVRIERDEFLDREHLVVRPLVAPGRVFRTVRERVVRRLALERAIGLVARAHEPLHLHVLARDVVDGGVARGAGRGRAATRAGRGPGVEVAPAPT